MDSPGLFSREWIETILLGSTSATANDSPGLFSREWIETIFGTASSPQPDILPAYLVGSGLKQPFPYHKGGGRRFSRLI